MNLIKRIIRLYQKKRNPIKYAKKTGVILGKNCKLNGSPNWGVRALVDINWGLF